ncbi:MAG: glycoside hydrolase family 9 protein [Chitinispirillaceae bacterium]
MKRTLRRAVTVAALLTLPFKLAAGPDDIRLNQVGYYPQDNKVAIAIETEASIFEVIKTSNSEVVFTGDLSEEESWNQSGETGKQADFSDLTEPGEYKVKIIDLGESHPFTISDDVLKEVAFASLKSYYFQRCSYELLPEYAGEWARPSGHPDLGVTLHESTGKSGTIDAPYGWYDAGDFGKYIVNSGITTGTLIATYELYPDYFGDNTGIPESGNGKPDILDEIKFNLDWMKYMQDEDGGVFFKLTTAGFPGTIMPHRDTKERYVIGKSTTSALDFAAVMAMAGRAFQSYDAEYAQDCIERAERAWEWAVANPGVEFENPTGISTGEYGDGGNYSDEFNWAAAELLITTKKDEYSAFLSDNDLKYSLPGWQNVQGLAALSLAIHEDELSELGLNFRQIKTSITDQADIYRVNVSTSLYRIPNLNFNWGSNSNFGNAGIALIYAYKLTGTRRYLEAAKEVADYLLGKNATTYCFVTGYGSKPPMHVHHRASGADDVEAPVPGLIAGGPNNGKQDESSRVVYPYSEPARSYVDNEHSYASNEVAINWNAPLTLLLAALDAELGDNAGSPIMSRNISTSHGHIRIQASGDALKVSFNMQKKGTARISLYDMKGSLVRNISLGAKESGNQTFTLNNASLANGVYLMKVKAGDQELVSRIQPVK